MVKVGVAVTPSEIDMHVGKGKYASKHILYLKILGYDFQVAKDGRNVVSYTLIKEPDNVAALLPTKKAKAAKAPSVPKAKVAAPKSSSVSKTKKSKVATEKKVAAAKKSVGGNAANLAKLREIGKRFSKPVDEVEETFGTTGELGAIDGGWDSIEGIDLAKLL